MDVESSSNEMIIMSVVYSNMRLGVSIYKSEDKIIEMCECWDDKPVMENLRLLILQNMPNIIISNMNIDEDIIRVMEGFDSVNIKLLKPKDFSYDNAKRLMTMLNLPLFSDNDLSCFEERTMLLSTIIRFENVQMIRSTGGLISYLNSPNSVVLTRGNDYLDIETLKEFDIEDTMIVDPMTFESLQIFKSDSSLNIQNSPMKENLSLIGLLDKTVSKSGKKLLKSWFLRPLTNPESIIERHKAISFIVDCNSEYIDEIRTHLKKVADILPTLSRIKVGSTTPEDWSLLIKTIDGSLQIRRIILKTFPKDTDVYRNYIDTNENIEDLAKLILSVIDFEESKGNLHVSIKRGINEELDILKNICNDLNSFLDLVAKEELKRYPSIPSLRMIYVPQVGFQIAIPINNQTELDYILELTSNMEGWEFQCNTDNYLYFKSPTTYELDEFFGDIHSRIIDLETNILGDIIKQVIPYFNDLIKLVNSCSYLDCIQSLAKVAVERHYTKPILTKENRMKIIDGRHPLQELCLGDKPFIHNSTYLSPEDKLIKVITGPNFSGKSVYLKQVALIVYMAHIGSFVPAAESVIPIVKRIFSLNNTGISVDSNKGSFLNDIQQVKHIFSHKNMSRSLIILDEFGRGTSHLDGISLLASTINFFIRQRQECPMVLISTHFHEILDSGILKDDDELFVEFQTMEVLLPEKEENDNSQLDPIFLYKLTNGKSTRSLGLYCAKLAGIPNGLIERSKKISECLSKTIHVDPISIEWMNSSNRGDFSKMNEILQNLMVFDFKSQSVDIFVNQCLSVLK